MPGTCADRGARIFSNEIDAQPCDNGAGVVTVQTVKGEAVVQQRGRLMEHLTSHLQVHLGPCLGYGLCGGQELIERWANGAVRHTDTLSARPRPGERIGLPLNRPAAPDPTLCQKKFSRDLGAKRQTSSPRFLLR